MPKASPKQRVLLIGLLTISLMVPPVLLGMAGQAGLATLFIYGGAIALIASFYDLRLAAVLSFTAGIAGMVAVLLNSSPLAGAIFFAMLTGASALAAIRGLNSPVLMVPIFISFVLVAPPSIPGVSTTAAVALTGAVLALGGLWTAASARVLFGRPSGAANRRSFSRRTTLTYAVIMAVVLGVATWGVLTFANYHQGAWLLMTLLIVMQPSAHDTWTKSLQRLVGTLVGGIVATLLIILGVGPPLSIVLAGVFLFIAFAARFGLDRTYVEFVATLTPGIILLDSGGGDGIAVAEDRVAFTVIAVIVAITISLIIKGIVLWKAPASSTD